MAIVHIALVGGQPAPVFYGIQATKPDIVVFIFSRDSEHSVAPIQSRLQSTGLDCQFEMSEPLDPADPYPIIQRATVLMSRFTDDHIIINIAGGTKSWAFLFVKVFDSHPDTTIVYVDQLNRLWNYRDMSSTQIEPLALEEHLELYGNPLLEFTRFSDYSSADDRSAVVVEHARMYNNKEFNKLTAVLKKELNHSISYEKSGRWSLPSGSFVEWEKARSGAQAWARIVLYKNGRPKEFFAESKHSIQLMFNSGWFEYKVAKLLSLWPEAKEILLNCHFKTRKNADKNEADIIIQTNSRLLFVECKTQLTHPTDVDKFRSVIRTYGGSASLGIFITESPMNEVGREKCEEHHLLPPFALSLDYAGIPAEKALFLLLDNAIEQINQ